jgi:hypothetical protein
MALATGSQSRWRADTLISSALMNNPTRSVLWFATAVIACSLVAFGVVRSVGRIYLSSGRGESQLAVPPLVFLVSCTSVAIACFVVLWFCAARAGYRMPPLAIAGIAVVALLFGVGSMLLGRPPYQNFLDGFSTRVAMNIKENEAIAWADQIFAENKLVRPGEQVVRLPQSKVPAFFSPVFSGATPSAVVSYSKAGVPICVHLFLGGGFGKWGVAIFNTNSVPTNNTTDYRKWGERLYTFHSNR